MALVILVVVWKKGIWSWCEKIWDLSFIASSQISTVSRVHEPFSLVHPSWPTCVPTSLFSTYQQGLFSHFRSWLPLAAWSNFHQPSRILQKSMLSMPISSSPRSMVALLHSQEHLLLFKLPPNMLVLHGLHRRLAIGNCWCHEYTCEYGFIRRKQEVPILRLTIGLECIRLQDMIQAWKWTHKLFRESSEGWQNT